MMRKSEGMENLNNSIKAVKKIQNATVKFFEIFKNIY